MKTIRIIANNLIIYSWILILLGIILKLQGSLIFFLSFLIGLSIYTLFFYSKDNKIITYNKKLFITSLLYPFSLIFFSEIFILLISIFTDIHWDFIFLIIFSLATTLHFITFSPKNVNKITNFFIKKNLRSE